MDAYLKFLVVASVSLVVGVPLWTLVFAPERSPLVLLTDPVFWVLIVVFLLVMLFGFWIGQRSKYT